MILDSGDSINSALLGFWSLQENSGALVRDLTQFNSDGLAENSPGNNLAPWGRARTFSNAGGTSTKRIDLGTNRVWSSLQIPMTIAAWVRSTSGSGTQTAFSQYSQFDADGKFGKWLGLTGGNVAATIGKGSGPFYQQFSGPAYTTNAWALIAWVLTGTISSPSLRIYYNTTFTDHTPVALGTVDASVPTWIGSSVLASTYPSNEGFIGDIGPVRLWARGLFPSEILRLVQEPWAGTWDAQMPLWMTNSSPSGFCPYVLTVV